MYEVHLSKRAQDFLDKLDNLNANRVRERLKNLEQNPVPSDSKFIGRDDNEKLFRYRIRSFRALYKIKEQEKVVLITKMDKRSKVYD